jgi:UDP-N-acetyl-D-glucosamine dehydrogenase
MKISVIGLGYVGLPLLCAIKKKTNYEAVGYDISNRKIQQIQTGHCPIDDRQCQEDLNEVSLQVSDNPDMMADSDYYIVCVPTPVLDDFTPDLQPLTDAVNIVANYLSKGQTIIIESTINPGVCNELLIPLVEEKTGLKSAVDFDLSHCPERINPGDDHWNVYNIPRNIGSTSIEANKRAADLYREFINGEVHEMPDLKTVEATKIIENTFRDINIAFVNELAKSFDVLGIDIMEVIKGASNKPFAFMPHYPGCGVGGHCIPVDPYYLIERARKSGFDHQFLKLARQINNSMPEYSVNVLADLLNKYNKPIKGTQVGLLGISYKANVGDLRQSPALEIKSLLIKKGAELNVFDPHIPELSTVGSLEELLDNSFAIILATNHKEFLSIDSELLLKHKVNIIVDGRNCLNKNEISSAGISYKGIGY